MKLKIQDIGTMIAERILKGRENGKACTVTIKFGKPFPDEKEEDCWYCPYSISSGSNQRLFYGAGVDSLQALRIAITMAKAELNSKYSHMNLTWMGEQDLGLDNQL
jgi:hypothetical protein